VSAPAASSESPREEPEELAELLVVVDGVSEFGWRPAFSNKAQPEHVDDPA